MSVETVNQEVYKKNVIRRRVANAKKPRELCPQEGEENFKRRPCNRGDACNVSGCTFWHPGDEGEPQPPKKQGVCKNGLECVVPGCRFGHPEGYVAILKACRFGLDCRKEACVYGHPSGWDAHGCKYGMDCRNAECKFNHPEGWVPKVVIACDKWLEQNRRDRETERRTGKKPERERRFERCGTCRGCWNWLEQQEWDEERERAKERERRTKPKATKAGGVKK